MAQKGTNGNEYSSIQSSQAWKTMMQYLPGRNADCDYWWQLTGRHLAVLVEAAGYPIEKQYEALMFHYHWTVCHPAFITYRFLIR